MWPHVPRPLWPTFAIFDTFMAAYSPAISVRIGPHSDSQRSFYAFQILIERPPPHPQTTELSLGVSLRVLRFLLGSQYAPLSVHLPHEPLTPAAHYLEFFGCRPYFAQSVAGFTLRTADLGRPLQQDQRPGVRHRSPELQANRYG